MKKKILYIIKTPPPFHGASIMNKYVYESKVLRDSFICKYIDAHYSRSIEEIGKFSIRKVFYIAFNLVRLLFYIIDFKPHLIYFQLSHNNAIFRELLFVFIIKISNKKVIYHLHGKGIQEKVEKSNFYKYLFKYIFKNSEVICLSKKLTYDIKSVYQGTPFILNNGKPINIETINKKIHNNIKILFLSNLIFSKGIYDFIKALSILKQKTSKKFQGVIIGDEGDLSYQEIKEYINHKGVAENILLLGPKYNTEKTELVLDADILVFPTFYENETWGLVILEAMEAGLAVISTKEGAIPEIIDSEKTGFLVEKNNPLQIAGKIEFLMNNPELMIKMGIEGREKFLEKYTIGVFEENLKQILEKVINYKVVNVNN